MYVPVSSLPQYEFCWICMGDWGDHGSSTGGYYKCNKYEAKEGEGDNDVAKAKAELDRYLHYYKRWVWVLLLSRAASSLFCLAKR